MSGYQKLEVGKAYRGPDGIVRWVTHESTRGYFDLLWLHEETNRWYNGGKARHRDTEWIIDEPYPAPQPGETYTLMGVFGQPRKEVVEEAWKK